MKLTAGNIKFVLLLTIFGLCLSSCAKVIQNDTATLNEIFEGDEMEIEIRHIGCFSDGEEVFSLRKDAESYELKSERTQRKRLMSSLEVDSLKDYLSSRIGTKDKGGCTVHTYLRVGNWKRSVDYRHSFCSGHEGKALSSILKYSDLVIETDE